MDLQEAKQDWGILNITKNPIRGENTRDSGADRHLSDDILNDIMTCQEGKDGNVFGRYFPTAAANTHIRRSHASPKTPGVTEFDNIKTCYAMRFKNFRHTHREFLNALAAHEDLGSKLWCIEPLR
ncbi:uncharacterized protein N7498_001685 [Penicillium cinerascens]|uniref:Uncharacterized protein n=1 Tax=Penicillium cinerascens TaxID=70096 RepID=A0A9W9N8L1_9EURO|nr:uncharacterized protein N7498_001685 [Penicillium cinerascens]KAJ5215278.1 hypothetical protein N7498_001685 [Penicillium cinerascens]